MKVYIAARFSRRPEAYAIATALQKEGHEIVCAWVLRHETHTMPPGLLPEAEDAERQRYALEDLTDMVQAEWCVSLMDEPRGNGRGGRHVEFGFMLANGALMTIIGPRETVFHHLPHVQHFASSGAFMASLLAGYTPPMPQPRTPYLEALHRLTSGTFYADYDFAAGPGLRVFREAHAAMEDFVAKVDRGEARSKRSYAAFRSVLFGTPNRG